mgnify:CR=1 FL=1
MIVVVRNSEPDQVPEHAPGVAAAPVVALDLIESGNRGDERFRTGRNHDCPVGVYDSLAAVAAGYFHHKRSGVRNSAKYLHDIRTVSTRSYIDLSFKLVSAGKIIILHSELGTRSCTASLVMTIVIGINPEAMFAIDIAIPVVLGKVPGCLDTIRIGSQCPSVGRTGCCLGNAS